jgi:hypothetical protein
MGFPKTIEPYWRFHSIVKSGCAFRSGELFHLDERFTDVIRTAGLNIL